MDDKNSKNRLRLVMSYLLSFLTSACITMFVFIMIIKYEAFGGNAINKSMGKCNYYNKIYNEFMDYLVSETLPTNLPLNIYEGVITKEMFKSDVNGLVDAKFSNKEYVTNEEKIREGLEKNIDAYLKSLNWEKTEQNKEDIKQYIDDVASSYVNSVSIPMSNRIIQIKKYFDKIFVTLLIVSVVLSLFMMVIIYCMNRNMSSLMKYAANIMGGVAIMITLIPAVIYSRKEYLKLGIKPESFYSLITSYINHLLKSFIGVGIVCFGIMFLFIFLHFLFEFFENENQKHVARNRR